MNQQQALRLQQQQWFQQPHSQHCQWQHQQGHHHPEQKQEQQQVQKQLRLQIGQNLVQRLRHSRQQKHLCLQPLPRQLALCRMKLEPLFRQLAVQQVKLQASVHLLRRLSALPQLPASGLVIQNHSLCLALLLWLVMHP